jgi:hypothetical protein
MADYCEGGQFDGYAMTTSRDRELCGEGGGHVVSRGSPNGGCAGDSVQNFAAASDERGVDTNALHAAQSLWRQTRENEVLTALSEAAVPAVELIIRDDPSLAMELVTALRRFSELSGAALNAESADAVYGEDDHDYFSRLARLVAERGQDDRLTELVETAISLGEPYRGLPPRDLQERLGPLPESLDAPESESSLEVLVPVRDLDIEQGSVSRPWLHRPHLTEVAEAIWDLAPVAEIVRQLHEAEEAIAEKARSLGAIAATPLGDMKPVANGFMRPFVDCDIYFSPATGAHEVHGDIRRKYSQVSGPTRLGLPTTDESSCPDGIGRYNHFAKAASIYWTPSTGPFYVRGGVRFRWAATGWEAGILGYPVRDEEGLGGLYPGDNPDMHWSHFQHGMVFSQGPAAEVAVFATASMQQIKDAIQATIARRLPTKSYEIGLITVTVRPGLYGVDHIGTDDWQYSFDAASPRLLRLKVRGFVSLPIVSDPTFEIDLALRFSTVWQVSGFTYPGVKTVVATLASSRITVNGVASGDIADAIKEGIAGAFTADPAHPEVSGPSMVLATVPTGANQRGAGNLDFLDVMLMADGSLNVFVNPVPPIPGAIRRMIAQNALNVALENL